ncbi:MAG: hypothetical protein WB607_17430 [Candidatus Acidiferrum sp.]|jgi:hypothetical protein
MDNRNQCQRVVVDGLLCRGRIDDKAHCVDANTFELQKRLATIYFHATARAAAMKLKNYGAASGSLKAILTLQDEPFPAAPQQSPASN